MCQLEQELEACCSIPCCSENTIVSVVYHTTEGYIVCNFCVDHVAQAVQSVALTSTIPVVQAPPASSEN